MLDIVLTVLGCFLIIAFEFYIISRDLLFMPALILTEASQVAIVLACLVWTTCLHDFWLLHLVLTSAVTLFIDEVYSK